LAVAVINIVIGDSKMTNRIVKVLGWGTGSSPAKITAVLDGETVFSGSVSLVEMIKDNEDEQTAPILFTFEIPMNFAGTKHMVISVEDAAVRFGQIVANYTEVQMGAISYSSGPDEYLDVAEYNADYVRDPRTNVTINGEKQQADRLLGKGTWHWVVTSGSKFEHDLTIDKAGFEE
jgi:hypothetical protein